MSIRRHLADGDPLLKCNVVAKTPQRMRASMHASQISEHAAFLGCTIPRRQRHFISWGRRKALRSRWLGDGVGPAFVFLGPISSSKIESGESGTPSNRCRKPSVQFRFPTWRGCDLLDRDPGNGCDAGGLAAVLLPPWIDRRAFQKVAAGLRIRILTMPGMHLRVGFGQRQCFAETVRRGLRRHRVIDDGRLRGFKKSLF